MKKLMMGMFILLFVVAVSCLGGVNKAEALLLVQIDDDAAAGVEVTVVDGGLGDVNPTTGVVTAVGAATGNFISSVATGTGYPVFGSPSFPKLDLNDTSLSGGAGTVILSVFQDGFGTDLSVPGFSTHVGGTTNGSVAFAWYINPTNALSLVGATKIDEFSSSSASYSYDGQWDGVTAGLLPDSLYSLALVATITHTAVGQNTSFDQELQPVPEPGTVALLGIGLAGLVGVGARRRAKKKAA